MDLSNENVIHIKKKGIEYLQFRRLLEYNNIKHGYSLGKEFNFRTVKRNDISEEEQKKSLYSYKTLCKNLNMDYINIVKPNQNHSDNVDTVNKKINNDSPDFNLEKYDNVDGLITNKSNLILSTTNADCILMLFFDPVLNVIANVHSGWRGTIQRISVKTVKKMKEKFGCEPENIICCICPSIRKCHFEVNRDVKEMFEKEFTEIINLDIIEKQPDKEKWNIDTVLINKKILENVGLQKYNIIDSKICSVCNSELIHSYRVEKQGYGLGSALIELI